MAASGPIPAPLPRAWYGANIADFLNSDPSSVLGCLTENSDFSVIAEQKNAWRDEIAILRAALCGLNGRLYLEFTIPRMGHRADAVLLIGPALFVLEFKLGETKFHRASRDQVWDYALDLKNFHAASHALPIVPILIATEVPDAEVETGPISADPDRVYRPVSVNSHLLRRLLDAALAAISGPEINAAEWAAAPYQPTPTIIEAARALYAHHSVENITRSDAEATNLTVTSERILEIVHSTRRDRRKAICFVTGVPGAGKTLVGLNVSTRKLEPQLAPQENGGEHAVFISGNGPLVAVLTEALTRDEFSRRQQKHESVRKGHVQNEVKAFIQNVHHFRDEGLRHAGPPSEHVVIFDEAQRAWNLNKTANFMRRKKNIADFQKSEPEFLISCMDRHRDWATIVCLVGGGQEINTGEAGIGIWLEAIMEHFPDWNMHLSPHLNQYGSFISEHASGIATQKSSQALWEKIRAYAHARFDPDLHLGVSLRSFRAEKLSAFVDALLDLNRHAAGGAWNAIAPRYPICITRNLASAKAWLRQKARGNDRFGMLASSKAERLKPFAIDIRVDVNPVQWFLNQRDHIRSSYYLEDVATEFDIQGLELDWACVTWDGDLRCQGDHWSHHDFRGKQWTQVKIVENQKYLLNAYRVLLTRARQGMVIFVPAGNEDDPTRTPAFYDSTFTYLRSIGLPVLN